MACKCMAAHGRSLVTEVRRLEGSRFRGSGERLY